MAGQMEFADAKYDIFCERAVRKYGGYDSALMFYERERQACLPYEDEESQRKAFYYAQRLKTMREWKKNRLSRKARANGCAVS